MRGWFIGVAAASLVLTSSASHGELNVPIAARILTFLLPPLTGEVPAAIVFEPNNASSTAEASAIEHAVGGGVSVGNVTIRTRRVPVSALDDLKGYRVAFITAGLRADYDRIAAVATRHGVVTITSDRSCVLTARCVVGIESGSRVQITVSRSAAHAAKARFGSAFLMLVKEI